VRRDLRDVSVIVPTRNEARNVPTFLRSLHPDVELVVVDASDDETAALVEALRPQRTIVIRSPVRIARARQLGAEAARGRWLLFTDADVAFDPGYWDCLDGADIGSAFFGPKHATVAHLSYSAFFTTGQRVCSWLGIAAASGSNMGMHRAAFVQAGGFRMDLPVNEDTELMMRLRRAGVEVSFVEGLAVHSLDDRRLDRWLLRKLLHSAIRTAIVLVGLYIPLPKRLLTGDWGYWGVGSARRAYRGDISP
jgi:glycosyltransferase involved in cell wall biosynthesis